MSEQEKKVRLLEAKNQIKNVKESISKAVADISTKTKEAKSSMMELAGDDSVVQDKIIKMNEQRLEQLDSLYASPYFSRCEIDFGGDTKDIFYFGKFSFTDEHIYSWITPVASLRFDRPGNVSYTRPDKTKRKGVLEQKDQFMIADGKIVFFATESVDHERELVYQEYFSQKKSGFVLPEIVAQMEKAQDTVIRAQHKGSLVISGPAGSGKTTLALHRVAYLLQSPDISDNFTPHKIVVFVQDNGTKEYFSHLLPELGITGVTITTFSTWVMRVLGMSDIAYVFRFGKTESEKDLYEYAKNNIVQSKFNYTYSEDVFDLLQTIYAKHFSKEHVTLFIEQIKDNVLDRFDLVILLEIFKQTYGEITVLQEYYKTKKSGAAEKRIGRFPAAYDLIIFDEFQNYLPAQIRLAKSCVNQVNNAIMYIGDMAQQTRLGTIQNWQQVNEDILPERQVVLQKVYRNTRHILTYIQSVGYPISIPKGIKEGEPVVEKITHNKEEEILYIENLLKNTPKADIGILSKDKEYLVEFSDRFKENTSVHVLTMEESQGVEFEHVILVGVAKSDFTIKYDPKVYHDLIQEKNKVNKDILYVALTRAIFGLHILGKDNIRDII